MRKLHKTAVPPTPTCEIQSSADWRLVWPLIQVSTAHIASKISIRLLITFSIYFNFIQNIQYFHFFFVKFCSSCFDFVFEYINVIICHIVKGVSDAFLVYTVACNEHCKWLQIRNKTVGPFQLAEGVKLPKIFLKKWKNKENNRNSSCRLKKDSSILAVSPIHHHSMHHHFVFSAHLIARWQRNVSSTCQKAPRTFWHLTWELSSSECDGGTKVTSHFIICSWKTIAAPPINAIDFTFSCEILLSDCLILHPATMMALRIPNIAKKVYFRQQK